MRIALNLFCVATLILLAQNWTHISAQEDFYATEHIPEINIYFTETNWDEILDQLYVNGLEERLLCSVEIDGTLLEGVGIRYKGFSSVSVDYDKNPFNIKLDYTIDGQDYQGFDKVKLSNVIQDPSFLREVLSYEIAGKYAPASRANFAKVFINGDYWGLYTNVEAVNKDFISDHFNSSDGAFFKCNPEELELFGENANLSNSPGTEEADYHELYAIKSDEGWSELVDFITILNENQAEVESKLNVDRALWMHALNYAIINFDSYVGYGQNYYVYQDHNGQFNPILWDMNMSFGSFRLTDDSYYFDGFNIEQAKTIDPLTHLNSVSVFPRPLMRNLFENDTYKRMYLAHMRTIMDENFSNELFEDRALELKSLIEADVLADDNKFYTDQDFQDNINSTVSDVIDYPGLTDLMTARAEYLSTYPGIESAPTISNVSNIPVEIVSGGNVTFSCEVIDAEEVFLFYRFDSGLFQKVEMLNSGGNSYATELTNISNYIEYYFYAQNSESGRFSPERAAYEYYTISSEVEPGSLVINELLAFNTSTVTDELEEYDDWIELFNNSPSSISTAGLHLSDELDNPDKWALPNEVLAPGEYLIIWADEQSSQGANHANFKLSSLGEFLSLGYDNGTYLDSLTYEASEEDVAYARIPNGSGPFILNAPSFGYTNDPISVEEFSALPFTMFPNPAREHINIGLKASEETLVRIYSSEGKLLQSQTLNEATTRLDVSQINQGVYTLMLVSHLGTSTKKLIIQN